MRIAALVPTAIINAFYRARVPMQALAERGHDVRMHDGEQLRDSAALAGVDVVYVLRLCEPVTQTLARNLKQAGVALVWDNDDHLTASPRGNRNHRQRQGLQGHQVRRGMTTMMQLADVVTTPSAMLAELYGSLGAAHVHVIENYLPGTFAAPRGVPPHEGTIVGWVAGGEHHRDAELLRLREVFEGLLARRPEVHVVTVGVNLRLRDARYHHIPFLEYAELPSALAQFDVGVAPLADIEFNRGRSNVKLKEYAAVGLPWLASPIGPYADMGEDEGGRLVPDDGWDEALERLLGDGRARRKLAKRARRWAMRETIEQHVERWERALQDAVARARTASAVG
jgi:glycosyltransferase involved in cell wall biosynthesis